MNHFEAWAVFPARSRTAIVTAVDLPFLTLKTRLPRETVATAVPPPGVRTVTVETFESVNVT
jgi:hypothetical protein